jgi:hypothetical protein
MAVAYSSIGTRSTATTGTSVTPALPATPAVGDLLIAVVLVKNNATITQTAGTGSWTKLDQTNSGASFTRAIFWKNFATGNTAPTFGWTGSVANGAVIARFTGVDGAAPILTTGTAAAGTTTPHTSTGITSQATASLFIAIDAGAANTAFTTPSGWTASFDSAGATGANRISMVRKVNSAVGASSGNISTTAGNAAWVEQQFEIQPPNTGSLATTESADTAAFAGITGDIGTLAATESADTASGTGTVAWNAVLAATESPDTADFVGLTADFGALAATESADIASFTGATEDYGTLAATEPSDVASFTGSIPAGGVWRRQVRRIGFRQVPFWYLSNT